MNNNIDILTMSEWLDTHSSSDFMYEMDDEELLDDIELEEDE